MLQIKILMSLTCNIRNLAGQVKHKLIGERRRSSSSHESDNSGEISGKHGRRITVQKPQQYTIQSEQNDGQLHRITTTNTEVSSQKHKIHQQSNSLHDSNDNNNSLLCDLNRSIPLETNNTTDKRLQKQQCQLVKSICYCQVNSTCLNQTNCTMSNNNNNNMQSTSPSSCIHNTQKLQNIPTHKICKQITPTSSSSPILQDRSQDYSENQTDNIISETAIQHHCCNQTPKYYQQHHSKQRVYVSNSEHSSNESQQNIKASPTSSHVNSKMYNQYKGNTGKESKNNPTTSNTTTVTTVASTSKITNNSHKMFGYHQSSDINLHQTTDYPLLNECQQQHGSTYFIPVVPDLSIPQDETRSGSLGSAYPSHCIPYHFGHSKYTLLQGYNHQHHLLNHHSHRHNHPNINVTENHNDNMKSMHNNKYNNPRLTMSYSELLNSLIPHHCHNQFKLCNVNNINNRTGTNDVNIGRSDHLTKSQTIDPGTSNNLCNRTINIDQQFNTDNSQNNNNNNENTRTDDTSCNPQVLLNNSKINDTDNIKQFMPTNHASRLLGRMSDKLRDGRLADVILIAGTKSILSTNTKCSTMTSDSVHPLNNNHGKSDLINSSNELIIRIPAHRVILAAASDYFAAMFGNELKEATEQEIWIHDVEPNALKTLINYIYTGYLDLREENVGDLLAAACFLQITEASQTCERFLTKRLDATNCLSMSRLSEQYGCELLRKRSTKFILEHFSDVAQQPDFLNLNFKELVTLVSSDRLKVSNEATVFAACLRWIRNAKQQECKTEIYRNEPLLANLLKCVRLTQVPPRLLIDVLEKETLFQEDFLAIRLVISALRAHFNSESFYSQIHKTQTRTNLDWLSSSSTTNDTQHKLEETINMTSNGINSSRTHNYNRYHHHHTDQPYQSPQFSIRMPDNQVLNCHENFSQITKPRLSTIGRLWALGGKTMTTTRALQEILEYDPYWNTWCTIGQLPGQRQQCGCTVLIDGRLLVVGGRDELKTLSTVECINIEEISQSNECTTDYGRKVNKLSSETLSRPRAIRNRSRQNSTDRNETDVNNTNQLELCIESASTTLNSTGIVTYRSEQQGQSNSQNCTSSINKEVQNKEEQGSWKIVSAMATHRHGLGVAVLEGVVYAVGGHDGWSYLNTVERWNGKAKAWSPVTPMAVQRSTVGVAVLEGLLYAVGGRDGSACLRTVERFNPHTQHWCFIAPMLHRRGGVGVGAIGGRLYAVGGHNAPPNQPHALRTASVEMYEPRTDMWTEVCALSSPRDSIAVAPLGYKLYALGGHDGQAYTDRVEVYDPEENKWTEAAPLPSGRAGIAVAASGPGVTDANFSIKLSYHKVDPLI
ncbi:kelch-like protein [Schistosoma mansoni]|uniref:kelch-like protein n=1 Tax=Schistosoma mansoni TaxID=6183 RepID=UPI00022DC3F9|nr:kelch-like protein [Schistosoma mansoni]|eukprot:XP_018650220.1 kelch-like protein [Schistosoma mansoni]